MSSEAYVVTATPTIMSGLVVRWHATLAAAESINPIISASREQVLEHQVKLVTPELRSEAYWIRGLIQRDAREQVYAYATHRHDGFLGPLVAIS